MKARSVMGFQRHLLNPLTTRLPGRVLIETTGRVSGKPRRTPVGGRLIGDTFWLVAEHGNRAYIRNIAANPAVRVRVKGRWRTGTAHVLRDDDVRERLRSLPTVNSLMVRLVGTDLVTVRVDLDPSR
jgi:deazaflavin-dependent oxidoreductase (nitroreductase family)